MLALSRTTRQAKGVSRHVRTLSTILPSPSSPDAGVLEIAPGIPFLKTRKPRNQLAESSAECMVVYPWNGIRSSAQGLAIARAVEEKYGPAKEVIFPRDTDSVTVFQPYFWLVYDNTDVRKRLPEESAHIRVHIEDLSRGDVNVGVEDMLRALKLPTDQEATLKPPPLAEGEGSVVTEEVDEGHKALDVRVEWARHGPKELLQSRRPPHAPLPDRLVPDFAAAWLAFDGFSPEAARGAHTPNLIRVREKWRLLAPDVVDPSTTVSEVGAEPELEPEPELAEEEEEEVNVAPSEWIPITLQFPSSTTVPKSDVDFAPAPAPDADADGAAVPPSSSPEPASTEIPVDPKKLSRRKRILHLARQNAEIPLPELPMRPQPVVEADNSQGESEQEGKKRTIRERLWRLVGGNH